MKHGCPSPSPDGNVVRTRVGIGTTTSLITLLPNREVPGGWMVWAESVDNNEVVIDLDMGRATQTRQFTIPPNGFRVFTIPRSSPVKIRGLHRGTGTSQVDIAAWPVDQVRWANPEFFLAGATGTAGADFANTTLGQLPDDANRVMIAFQGQPTSVANLLVEGVDRAGTAFILGNIQLAANARASVFEIVPGFFTSISVTSTGVVPAEVLQANGAAYRGGR